MRCVQHILVRKNGDELVQIRTSDRFITLHLSGSSAVRGPICVTLLIGGLGHVRRSGLILLRLADLAKLDLRWPKRTRRQLLMRDALICLDGKGAGATYREIAVIIYGRQRATAAWNGTSRSLKDRIRYALARGLQLRNGAYRSLLMDGV